MSVRRIAGVGIEKRTRRSIAPNCLRTSFNPFENQEFKGERDSSVWRATMADVKRWTWRLERCDLEHAARSAAAANAGGLLGHNHLAHRHTICAGRYVDHLKAAADRMRHRRHHGRVAGDISGAEHWCLASACS